MNPSFMPSLRQVQVLAQTILRHPSAALALARWRPFSTTSFEMMKALERQGVRPGAVIDGGANKGQFARAVVESFPETLVFSFEPLPHVAARFRKALGGHPRVRLFEVALGPEDGTVTFHPQPYDLASSVLTPIEKSAEQLDPITVASSRLDTLLKDEALPGPVLLKLDLQGYELEALRGATETLARADFVLLEVALQPSYEGEPTFEQLYDFLRGQGFVFRAPLDTLEADGKTVQMDALFERA